MRELGWDGYRPFSNPPTKTGFYVRSDGLHPFSYLEILELSHDVLGAQLLTIDGITEVKRPCLSLYESMHEIQKPEHSTHRVSWSIFCDHTEIEHFIKQRELPPRRKSWSIIQSYAKIFRNRKIVEVESTFVPNLHEKLYQQLLKERPEFIGLECRKA